MRPSRYWGNQVLNFVIHWNCCLVGSESHSDHFVKSDSKKPLSDIFHVITFRFPNITFIAISFISKMVDGVTYLLFAACLTAQQVNETSLQSKLVCEASECNNFDTITNLTPRVSMPSALFSFNRIWFRSCYVIFRFPALLLRYR